ncbi:hypothetical protein SZ00_03270 [Rhodococcus sp. AD45]|nr:hypothetical protein SZ00_03270 [Rhodococcus sp. AD45]
MLIATAIRGRFYFHQRHDEYFTTPAEVYRTKAGALVSPQLDCVRPCTANLASR